MINFSSSKRFAQAIYLIAKEKNNIDTWKKNLSLIDDTLSNSGLVHILNSPQKPIDTKCNLLNELFGKSLDKLCLNLLYVLSIRNSIDLINKIKSDFENLVDIGKGVQKALVTTATSLNNNQTEEIKNILESISGKTVSVKVNVNKNIIGGFKAIMGDTLIDASLENSLDQMRKTLKN